ncbi:conserved hypothetical protein [Methanocaldococcus vulcanius M7]|uniref:Uncharacterized protein n=1 Tax=Methanocaldococcus vulcanius (strain ATCC 700851 / DSM 12094 / M7) TaxID=579137 RepID=C9RI18_METVM|nr:hypothetical protein [Methanocaldococcus vulcanius]ACX73220.1 conserved hypothetical protein [Methanocaldococcus vulcanius M7]
MDREEFFKYLKEGKYDKLAKLINKDDNALTLLEEILASGERDLVRRGFLVLKRLDDKYIVRFLPYIVLHLKEKRTISKEAEEILKDYTTSDNIDDAIIDLLKKSVDDSILEELIYIYIENANLENVFYRAIKEYYSIEELMKNYDSKRMLKILTHKLYSDEKLERDLALNLIYDIVERLDEDERELLKKHLDIILLGYFNKRSYKKIKRLFEILGVKVEISEEDVKKILKTDGKAGLNIILRENISLSSKFYDREFFREYLYSGDEERQFIGVKLISLRSDSKIKVDNLFKFLNYGYGKAKTSAIRELKKIAKNNPELKDYIENKTLMYVKKMNLPLKISSLRILKEIAKKEHLTLLINEHKRLKNLAYRLEEEKFMGGFRHMIMMEEEIRRCNIAMNLIEEIIAKICLDNNISYKTLKIAENLGYEFYKTIEIIGSKNLNLIDINELLEDIKRDGELIIYLTNIIANNGNIDENLKNKIIKVIENIDMADRDILNANKIIIYSSFNMIEKIGEIINMAEGYYSKLAFINAVKRFMESGQLKEDYLCYVVPKIAEMLYATKKLRLMALEFFKKYPHEIALPILLRELGNHRGEEKITVEVISNIIEKFPCSMIKIKNLLNTEKRELALKILLKVSKNNPEILKDFIYLLAGIYGNASREEKSLIGRILKNIADEEQKLILKPIIGDI